MVSENSIKFLYELHAIYVGFLPDANIADRNEYLIGLEHMRIIDTH